ncbi:hypothetical protein [Mycolicibacterium stellerae]|uniref:hypothetical protein n=1 Tax=Mycolicibacterium stellerae TaxID=2358193 RepID=UPI000F0B420C|nr:hypothetical protein [Mycolicibacterium stellerae]
MTRRRRIASAAIASTLIGFGALGMASAVADPAPPLIPGEPVPPGQPVIEPVPAGDPVGGDVIAAPPPAGPPMVPEISNPKYGSGNSSGPLGFLKDAWNQAKDPYNFAETPEGEMPGGAPPPPGAGPAPQLPPGFKSLNAPGSEAPPTAPQEGGGPPLPEGYYPISGPPPPGYFDAPPPAADAPPGMAPIPVVPPPTP